MRRKKGQVLWSHEIMAGLMVCAVFLLAAALVYSLALAEDVTITAVVEGNMFATIDSVMPQGRVGADQTNSDTTFYLTVKNPSTHAVLFSQSVLATTDVAGTYSVPIQLTGISEGDYDVGLKGHQHLTRILRSIHLINGTNVLNFTKADNSPGRGTQVLLAGDVNGAGTTPATLGDDTVNSVDISTFLTVVDDDDVTGNTLRPNINQDIVVNSVDLSWMISNLDVVGDQ